jgi:MFS family permease
MAGTLAKDSRPEASGTSPTPTSLWRNRDFVALLCAETVSQLGSQITLFALPMAAILLLGADGGQIGLLKTLFTLPYFLLPLAVGVFLDRRPRRTAMLVANFGRMLLVFSIPAVAWLRLLTMNQLLVVALLGGFLAVVFDLAYAAYLPSLIGRDRLGQANSITQTGYSTAFLAGPGVAGLLVNAFGAASALVADALSYLVSFVTISRMRFREPVPDPGPRRPFAEAWEGVTALFGIGPIRAIALHASLYNAWFQLIEVAFLVYALNVLHIGAGAFGLVVTAGGVGGLLGALSGARVARRLGYGRAMVAAATVESLAYPLLAAAHGGRGALLALFAVTFFVGGAGTGAANVLVSTIRQTHTPDRLMARVGAGYRMMNAGAVPVGAAAGGLLVTAVGARTTLWIAPAGLLLSVLPLVLTASLRRLRELPAA